jgi:hypothetical protein
VNSQDFLDECVAIAKRDETGPGYHKGQVIDTGFPPPDNSHLSLPQDFDADFEANSSSYYFGLPSIPVLVYRTGDPPTRFTGPKAYRLPKEAMPVFDHPIVDAWDELGPQVPDYLDSVNVTWTTIDVVRFLEAEVDIISPPVLWIGVKPGSLSREDAEVAAIGCEELLKKFELTDVEVAFRESVFTRSARHHWQLLKCVSSFHATADVRSPLTPALGLQIAARATPFTEGTGALYICEGGDSTKVFVLTARHVVLPQNAWPNELYTHNVSQPRHDVLHLGCQAFQDVLVSITAKIKRHAFMVNHYNEQLKELATRVAGDDEDDVAQAKKEWTKVEGLLLETKEVIDTLNEFDTQVRLSSFPDVLGHIAYSPPISVGTGTKRFTEDWALIELNDKKIDWKTFKGNAIDLGVFRSMSPRSFSLTVISRH